MRNKVLHTLFILFSCLITFGQDPQFTQFYASPLYLNPAFTGLTYEHRFSMNYRNQWTGIKTAYSTDMVAYDYNASNLNSGLGAFVLYDRAGTSNLVTQQEGFNFAYRIKINKYSELRLGLAIGLTQKRLDYTNLIVNDQLAAGSGAGPSKDALSIEKVNYTDMGCGALYNSMNYWLGASTKHINQPNASMVGNTEALPVYVSVHGGYRYIISARGAGRTKLEEFVSASFLYKHELKSDQFDIGAYYFREFLNLGVWYRGLPFKHYKPRSEERRVGKE